MHAVFQHAQRDQRRFRRKQRCGGPRLLSRIQLRLAPHAAIGEHGVQSSELAHAHFRAAEHETESVMLFGKGHLHARSLQKAVKSRSEPRGQHDGGDVAACAKRLLCGQRTAEDAVEVLGIVAAEAAGGIFKKRAGMDEPLIKSHAVNEGLERRTGGTSCLRAVHLTGNGVVEEICGARQSPDFHARPVNDQCGGVGKAVASAPCGKTGQGSLQNALKSPVDEGSNRRAVAGKRQKLARHVRSVEGKRSRPVHAKRRQGGHAGERRRAPAFRTVLSFRQDKPRHSRPCALEIRAVQGRTPHGILRHRGKSQTFRKGKPGRRHVKIDARGGSYALNVAPIRRKIEISLENLILAVVPLILKRACHLHELARGRGGRKAESETRHLHGDGGTAHAPRAAQHGKSRPQRRKGIYARMPVKVSVLVQKHGLHGFRGHLVQRHPYPVLLVARQPHAEQPSSTVEHEGRELHAVQKRRPGAERQPETEDDDRGRHERKNDLSRRAAQRSSSPNAPFRREEGGSVIPR